MRSRFAFCSRSARISALLLLATSSAITVPASAQTPSPSFTPLPPIPFDTSGPVLRAPAQTEKPFTVAGERGVLLGQQNGILEAWVLPVKLLSHLAIEATVEGYSVPINVNQQASTIEVRPDRTVLTYAHIGFTVRQIMFSPATSEPGTGPVILYEFDCLHPTDFTFRFLPNLEWMWPERNEGVPGVEWALSDPRAPGGNGYYVLHSDYPDLAGALTIPGAQPGILAPYQERPQDHPVELKLHIDPIRDQGKLFPLLLAAGMNKSAATNAALGDTLAQLNAQIPALYRAHAETYKKLLANTVSIETPDKALNEAFQWAVISIEQLRTAVPPTAMPSTASGQIFGAGGPPPQSNSAPETALVAGYYASGDSARPGFGWFFGRDALYTLYAVNGFGDFALTKSELEFLIRRQREDGKIMHEYSQTADAVDWRAFPYMYAAADATPLFLLAAADYVRSSGDTAFLTANRDAIEKAWAFETDPAHDTDHDGIYDNSQGTGWVESWPGGMPHQEIYLALLDQQASSAMASLEDLLKDPAKAASARTRAGALAKTINAEYYDSAKGCYAFSRNLDGSLDHTTTVYPAMAWWDPAGGKPILEHPDDCLRQLADSALNTDWGLRDVANTEKIYDGMSYHQGSVWPLFTGWAALAEYRGNQPLAGFQLLMENANLTRAQDLGADTELLSGDFFVPFGRSTSHQLWSSAMVITPTLRGLFGISIDAQSNAVIVDFPRLPPSWDHAEIRNVAVGSVKVDLVFSREAGTMKVKLLQQPGGSVTLRNSWMCYTPGHAQCGSPADTVTFGYLAVAIDPVALTPVPGDRAKGVRVLSQRDRNYGSGTILTLEGLAGTEAQLRLVVEGSAPKLHAEGGTVLSPKENSSNAPQLRVHFPPGEGFKTITVTLTW